jgi:aspartyl-tRNA(Asn)/glutamyl-tRNA(Gln) amidotransferase subunit A
MLSTEFVKKIHSKEIDVVKNINKVLDETEKINKEYNYFNVLSKNEAKVQAQNINKKREGKLAGIPISIKDCICVKDIESRAGSKILSGYKPVFDATAVARLKKQGAIIIGKTSQDAFGFGSFNTNVGLDLKIPKNPIDKDRVCGGSSGGSAGITKKLQSPHMSLAESTGGSIVAPASFCDVVGLCPTYGRVSRYGLMDYANSLDKIGPITKTVYDGALMLEIISGHDHNESTSLNKPIDNYTDYINKDVKGMKIGVIKSSLQKGTDKVIQNTVWEKIKQLENLGVKYEEIDLPLTDKYSLACYYLIAMAETSTNLAKYCGIRYGKTEELKGDFNQYFKNVRSKNFNMETKRRIMLGTFARMAGYRDAYYLKALKVRTLIIEEYKKMFKKYDCLVSPTMPILPPKFTDVKKLTPLQNYKIDILTTGPNLAGLPHLTLPIKGKTNLPIGMMFIGDHLMEKKLIMLASSIEEKN